MFEAEPTPIVHPSVWYGTHWTHDRSWVHELSAADGLELEAASEMIANRDLAQTSKRDFPLPSLGPRLEAIKHEVVHGRGFALIRGFPTKARSLEQIARMYWGLGLWLGEAVTQNRQGQLLGHVHDIGADASHPTQRGFQSSDALPYHTDLCADIVSLLCLTGAKSGGESSLASAPALHNEMLRNAPKLLQRLYEPFFWDRRGEHDEQMQPWFSMPVFARKGDYLLTSYIRRFIDGAQQFDGVPPLDAEQIEALDLLATLAASDRFRFNMNFIPGDIQLIHNHAILHNRTAYVDFAEPERRRHLLRLWLVCADGWPLSEAHFARYPSRSASGRPAGVMNSIDSTAYSALTIAGDRRATGQGPLAAPPPNKAAAAAPQRD